MLIKTRLSAVAAATALTFASLAGISDASVKAGWDDCPDNHFCIWDGLDGTGRMASYHNGSSNVTGQGIRDAGRSAWNRTQAAWCIWNTTQYGLGGFSLRGQPGERGNLPDSWPIRSLHRPDWVHCLPA